MASTYQALYRRFRPQSFSEIFGQPSIVSILKKQISSDRISHAYLFCGSRGTGKTSTAKVFAKAANCLAPVGGEACGKCAYCLNFREGFSDIIEIDAASNRGIDEIRELRERISILPSIGRYRIYIVDEVHMLTPEAFNALLKTLEEPPSHVIFIFATTDPSKVPPTILSRCQRFDFSLISQDDMVAKMKAALDELGYGYELDALYCIAESSDGALRDALSVLDKAIAIAAGSDISIKNAQDALGAASPESVIAIAYAICTGSPSGALSGIAAAIRSSTDASSLFSQLIEYFRSLLIYITVSKPEEILAKSKTELDSYEACRMHVSPGKLVAFVKELSKAKSDSRNLPSPRYLLEAICVALADSSFGLGSSNLGLRIERLEKMVEAISQGEQVLPAQQQKIEQAPTAPEDAAQPAPEEFPQLAPQEASLASFQKELAFASNYIAEQGKDPYMSQIFKMLRVVSYSNGVLTIAPTKDAIAHMGYFNDKNGEQKIADIIKGRNGLSLTVQIADNGDIPPIDFFSEASQAFGELTDFDG